MVNLIVGNTYKLRATFRNASRQLADPTEVVLRHRTPTGSLTIVPSGDIVHESLGIYSYDLVVTEAGLWHYRFVGTGDLFATNPEQFLALEAVP